MKYCNAEYFPKYAESIPDGETSVALSNAAKENNIYVVGGTIPEIEGDKLYNTCTIWGPDGALIAKHRKVSNMPLYGFEFENIGVKEVSLSRNNLGIYICTYVYYNQFYNLRFIKYVMIRETYIFVIMCNINFSHTKILIFSPSQTLLNDKTF